jgi:hypothetical protein
VAGLPEVRSEANRPVAALYQFKTRRYTFVSRLTLLDSLLSSMDERRQTIEKSVFLQRAALYALVFTAIGLSSRARGKTAISGAQSKLSYCNPLSYCDFYCTIQRFITDVRKLSRTIKKP